MYRLPRDHQDTAAEMVQDIKQIMADSLGTRKDTIRWPYLTNEKYWKMINRIGEAEYNRGRLERGREAFGEKATGD